MTKCSRCHWRDVGTNKKTGELYTHGLCWSCWREDQVECTECPNLRKGEKINTHDRKLAMCYACSQILKGGEA